MGTNDSMMILLELIKAENLPDIPRLLNRGMPVLSPESKENKLKYILRAIGKQDGEAHQVEWLFNKYEFEKFFDEKSDGSLNLDSKRLMVSSYGHEVEVQLALIKKHITLLVYEKVPDTS